uniref:Uncharacterized protein n=1 Tax=Anguilla anguilla TaxID=7936 RepID=A0A0E9RHU0_ANGAN
MFYYHCSSSSLFHWIERWQRDYTISDVIKQWTTVTV